MKATDLRHNNYVEQDGECCAIFPRQLFEFAEYQEYGAKEEVYRSWKPIPITEEWLMRFGFEDQSGEMESEGWSIFAEDGRSISIHIRNGKFTYLNADFWPKSLDYVHQLQNLFHALTQTELTTKG